jgi:UDP-N-acetylmuramyl tripeptide synthase
VRLALEIAAARAAGRLSRLAGRGGGTTLPGKLLATVDPAALSTLAGRLPLGCALVSATNGKTTTSAIVASILGDRIRLAHNRAGANLVSGVASALLAQPEAELGLFEVDEGAFPDVARRVRPQAVCLGNLFRDQLDRYGELELIADRWRGAVAELDPAAWTVVNADDPLIAGLAQGRPNAVRFGLDDPSVARERLPHAADSKYCVDCGTPYTYRAAYVGHLGDFRCPGCGKGRPALDVTARSVSLGGLQTTEFELVTPQGSRRVTLGLPGLYNVYNALAAATAALELGVPLDRVREGLESTAAVFGRVERLTVGGREVSILLVKNPVGANEVLRTLTLEDGRIDLWLALNDRIADGRDVSWIWDADFELLAGRVRRATCSGTRAEEMALRLKYAGIDGEIAVERDLERSLDAAVADQDGGVPLYALPTYTALLDLRNLLADRGVAGRWSE